MICNPLPEHGIFRGSVFFHWGAYTIYSWLTHSEVAHTVADRMERPFVFLEDGAVRVMGLAVKEGDEAYSVLVPLR